MDREQFTPSDIRYIESMIASMRVNELQTVLSMFKMPKLGKKQELIQRCTELLRTPSVQIQVASQVKLMVGKSNRMAPYQIPVRGYVPNGTMMNGNTSGYTAYRNTQLIHPLQSATVHQCRVLRNLVLMDLPFYDVHQVLLEPMELSAISSGVKTPCKQSFSFSVPRERLGNWSQSAPLPRFEIQLRFFQLPQNYASEELADDFPLNCVVRIEDQLVQLPSVIPTNKPNVEPKRPSRPVDITQNCMSAREPTRPLRLMVEWTGDKRTWVVAIYLVYRLTSEILRDRATGAAASPMYGTKEVLNHWLEEHVTRDLIRARLIGSGDDDIAMAQLKISLLCPLSRTRITLPARCKNCSHLQCFDLFNFLLMNEKRPTWRCPVCSDWAPFKNIIIDGYFKTVLADVDKEAVEVELLVDGSYRAVKSECIDIDDDDIPSMSATNSTMKSSVLSSKTKTNVDDIIVLSDSDDEEEEQVDQAIRRSLSETGPMRTTSSPRSNDSSIIIIDDESPPGPATTSIQNTTGSCSSSSLPSILASPNTSSSVLVSCPISSPSITSTSVLGAASRLAPSQPHGILNGRQNVFNSSSSLSYYHQSQWSQPTTSRPHYPTSHTHGSLNAGGNFTMTYKQHSQTQLSNLLGRYQPSNSSTLPFNYPHSSGAAQVQSFTTGGTNSGPAQVQPFSAGGTNLQQVLASLVQQRTYSNGGGSNSTMPS